MKTQLLSYVLACFFMIVAMSCKNEKKDTAKETETIVQGPQSVKSSNSNVDIHYTVEGTGSHALVFVHGWSCDATYWDKQVPFFTSKYKVITLDLGGHGKSGTNRTDWSMNAFANDVADVIKAVPHGTLSLVGHSMGSVVVLNTVDKLDIKPDNLVFVDYFGRKLGDSPITEEAADKMVAGVKADFVNVTKTFVKRMFTPSSDSLLVEKISSHMASAKPEIGVEAMKSMLLNDVKANFNKLDVKNSNAHIINSGKLTVDSFYDSIGIKSHFIKDSGHFLMIEKDAEFNSILSEILE